MLTEEQIDEIQPMVKSFPQWKFLFAREIERLTIAAVDAERAKDAVAWRHTNDNGINVVNRYRDPGEEGWKTEPLYLSPAIPTGFALVPIEPTMQMLIAGRKADEDWLGSEVEEDDGFETGLLAIYKAMIAAA